MANPDVASIFGPNWRANAQAAQNSGGAPWLQSGDWYLSPNYTVLGDYINGGGPTSQTLDNYSMWRQLPDGTTVGDMYDPAGNYQRSFQNKGESLLGGAMTTLAEGAPLVGGFALGANALFPMGGLGGGGAVGGLSGMDIAADTAGFGGSWAPGAEALSGMDIAADTPGFGGAWSAGGGGMLSPSTPLTSVGSVGSNAVTPVTAAASGSSGLFGLSPSALGAGASLLGGALGSQGVQKSETTSNTLNPQLQSAMFGGVLPMTQGLLADQMPTVKAAGQQMANVGAGLLATQAPTTAQNPYLTGQADDIQRRTAELLGQNNMAIQGNAVASGGLGGARQGIAQGTAAAKAADYLQGNLANLYGQNYQFDQNNYLNKLNLGANLQNTGYGLAWQPLKAATGIYGSMADSTKTTTSTASQGGGAQGVLGGMLGGAQFAKNAGWWG